MEKTIVEEIEIGSKLENTEYIYRECVYGIVRKDDKILMVHNDEKDQYAICGGGLEAGETPEQALKREFLEESGYPVLTCEEFLIATNYTRNPQGQRFHKYDHFFYVTIDEKNKITPLEPWHTPVFVEIEKAAEIDCNNRHREILKRYMSQIMGKEMM